MHVGANVARSGWYHRVYAALLVQFGKRYERLVSERKRELLGGLRGRVVEIGAGVGANLRFLPTDAEWCGVDPNPHVKSYLLQEAARCNRPVDFRVAVAEDLPFAEESVDAVISTLVLCSVSDPSLALAEILRILRPGGAFTFIEHVAADSGSTTRRRQDLICPLWRRLADGCHPNRETGTAIDTAGFSQVSRESFRLNLPIAGPHISGIAFK